MEVEEILKNLEEAVVAKDFDLDKINNLIHAYIDWAENQSPVDAKLNSRFEGLLLLAQEKAEIWDNADA